MAEMKKRHVQVDIHRQEGGSPRHVTPPSSPVDRRLPIWQIIYGKNGKQVLFFDTAARP